jgi:hypothetical protein
MPVGAIIGAGAAVIGAGAAVYGTVESVKNQKKAAKEAKKANRFQRQMTELQSARQRIDALRQGRQAGALAQQQSANQGMEGSSIGEGGAGSIYSQTASNLSFLGQYGYFADQATSALQKSANASGRAGMWQSIAGLGAQVYSASGGFKFTGPTPPPPPKAG